MRLNKKPYLIDAIVGNSCLLASMSRTGRLFRLWWPHIDFPQHVDEIRTGLRIDGKTAKTSWFDAADDGWKHEGEYVFRTNIFSVKASSDNCEVNIDSAHFAVPGENMLIRVYSFANCGNSPVSFKFFHYTSFMPTENELYNAAYFDEANDALVHYRHSYCFAVSSANVCSEYQIGNAWQEAVNGRLGGNDIGMAPDGALCWRISGLMPGETAQIPVYICAGSDRAEATNQLQRAKNKPPEEWYSVTDRYWKSFLSSAVPCPLEGAEATELYERSLLAMKLMIDEQSGAIVAAPEFDEHYSRCGGYSYCWGRDAAFITSALNKAGLTELSDHFYQWALSAQDADGSWQQRHYHDGRLAPSWGLQIDEGSSILWGMWQYFRFTSSKEFLHKVWPAVMSGADFLIRFVDPDTGLPLPSRDLWEERLAEHTYSAATVCAGLSAAAMIAEQLGETHFALRWKLASDQIGESIDKRCWNEEAGVYYRGLNLKVTEETYRQAKNKNLPVSFDTNAKGYVACKLQYDPTIDVSLLGLAVPFGVIAANDPRMVRTADAIERCLTVPGIGGLKRYEDDHYAGGNPWVLTTLWLAQYRIASGQNAEAKALLQWVIDHRTETGLLPEQVDKNTGRAAWVVPLTWSHAMYILSVHLLAEKQA